MALRVTNVATPAAGQEWSFAIPGQYVYDVRSIVASYFGQTTSPPTVITDVSGNGLDGTYDGALASIGFGRPGLVAGDTCVRWAGSPVTASCGGGTVANGVNYGADYTLECWYRKLAGIPGVVILWDCQGAAPNMVVTAYYNSTPNRLSVFTGNPGDGAESNDVNVILDDGNPHHIVIVVTPPTATFYVDGVDVGTALSGPLAFNDASTAGALIGFHTGSIQNRNFEHDEVAAYQYALTAGQVAAHHAAAAVSFAAYDAAVLGDGPSAYYHLDDVGPNIPQQRYTALTVSDGTHVVATYTSGELSSLAGATTFVWTPGTSAVVATGTRVVIGVPPLILNAGYVIGSNTPTIGPVDQWSNIAIWWDDALTPAPGAGRSWKYRNVMLLG